MNDPRLDNFADIMVNYSTEVKPGQSVYIHCGIPGLPLMNAVMEKVLQAGGHPVISLDSDTLEETYFRNANDEQLEWINPVEDFRARIADVSIFIRAPENTRALNRIDPQKQQLYSRARNELTKIRFERAASGDQRWVLTNYPCEAYAQDADMSVRDFEDFVFAATYADKDDPVAAWQKVKTEQQRLVEWLYGKKQITVKSPDADLTLSIEGRTFLNACGQRNLPDGEIFTGPVEDSVNGWVRFAFPANRYGRSVEGVEFEFKDGKVVTATAAKNEAFLLSSLDSDSGARYLGEFAFGLNEQVSDYTGQILFDEKIGGTIHMAIGRGFPETGSKNESNLHWDFICDTRRDSEVYVDGELFFKNGQVQI